MQRAGTGRDYVWLALALLVQTALLTYRPDLLPMWNDELFTVKAVELPLSAMLQIVRGDVHPPLYFVLAHGWNQIGLGENTLLRTRLLSVIFTLLATVAIDRLWLRTAPRRIRFWCLALWVCSACVLLYARMARSYSLQVLLFVVVCWAVVRWNDEFASWRRMLVWIVSLAALLYTHYVPGIAAWAGSLVLLWRGGRSHRLLAANFSVLLAYLPWLVTFASVLSAWRAKPGLVLVASNGILEWGVKLAYWVFSFFYGEAIPVWMLPVTGLLAIPVLWLFRSGVRTAKGWVLPAAVATAVGFAGVAGWVSYAFGPARLLFLLPLVVLALAHGASRTRRARSVIAGLLLAANLVGVAAYFQARDLLNVGYLAPMDRIAQDIASRSSPDNTLVLVDGPNLSGTVLEYYLSGFKTRQIFTAEDAAAVLREAGAPAIRHVWFLRNPRDVTPGHVLERLETDLLASWRGQLHPYVPFSPTHVLLMRAANFRVSAEYLYSAWEFQEPPN